MSEFSLLLTDICLQEASTKGKWGLLDFCSVVIQFLVWVTIPAQLVTLSKVGAWGEAEKPMWDMAFLLIAPSTDAGGE